MIPKRDYYEGLLLPNASWVDLPERHMMLRMIYKDLGELYAEDDEFATEVSFVVKNWLATANWKFKSGPIPIWKGMFSRAKGIVRKKMGNGDLDQLSKGLLKHGNQNTAAGFRSRTSGVGGHDVEQGSTGHRS